MTTPTIHGAEHDLAVIREVRDRILAGDWGQFSNRRQRCLVDHLASLEIDLVVWPAISEVVFEQVGFMSVSHFNDTHTQAEIVALLDDVEDSLLGEFGVVG